MYRISLSLLAAASLAVSSGAIAQSKGTKAEPKVNTIYIYGDDECPESTDDVITVCGILVEGDRYRIPEELRGNPNDPSKEAWTRRVEAYRYVGREGTMSCSATGGGGFTGCGLQEIDAAYAEKKQDPGKLFGRLIAQKRAERLAEIDAEAAEVEERVKQFEAGRADREAREAAARSELDRKDAVDEDTEDGAAEPKDPDSLPLPEPQ